MNKLQKLIAELCPKGIPFKTLAELGKFFGGLTGKSKDDFKNGNAKFITYRNVYSNPALQINVEDTVKIENDEKQHTLQYADIIFTGSSETPDECGFSSVVTTPTKEKLYLNSFCFFFRFNNPEIMLPGFAKHLFRSNNLRYQIGKTASGVTRFNVSKKLMEKVLIPVPPLPVQEEIVRILDNFTELTNELIARLKTELTARKKQYEYYRDYLLMSGDNTSSYCMNELAEFVTVGIANSATHAYSDIGIIMFRNQNIKENQLDDSDLVFIKPEFEQKYKSKRLKEHDILITRTGYPGQACVVPKIYEGCQTFTTLIVRLNDKLNINPHYVCYYINSKYGKAYVNSMKTGAAQKNFGATALGKMPIILPKIEVQNKVVQKLKAFSKICANLDEGLSAEIQARQKQYEYYRDKLLTFSELPQP